MKQYQSAFNKMAKLYKDEVLIVDEDDNIIGIFTKNDLYKLENQGKKFSDNLENYIKRDVITISEEKSIISARNING